MRIEQTIKVILIILLLLCLLHMPYGYYKFIRIASTVGFSILAFQSYKRRNDHLTVIYCVLVLLFQPLYKIYLGRELWQIVDIIAAAILFLSIFFKNRIRLYK